ncbi:hypothetical protein [Streptomyces griseofuscus]|uniref:Uncharacterized protein n=1 Tax=Streptomyces griseofuscus TaxID=146922 RepID=A0A7H1Q3J4_9ACTN|nr:hypothetical protein [Streptomyces griseofuscus]QNT94874.1 hypothetical protein HEP81_04601 [Streptomyces griseofuscus]
MAQITDRRLGSPQGVASEHESKAAEVLATVAGVLATEDPKDAVDSIEFAVLVGAKAYAQAGRSCYGGGVNVSRLALQTVGRVPAGVSREEFSVAVAQAARALGYDWAADDNRRVIPTIPAPRPGQGRAAR